MSDAKIIFKNLVLITGRRDNCVSAVLPAATNHEPVLRYHSKKRKTKEISLNRHKISVKGLKPGRVKWDFRSSYDCPSCTDTSFEWLANINDYWKDVEVLPEAFNLHSGLSAAYIHLANGCLDTVSFVEDSSANGKVAKLYLDGDIRSARAFAFSISWKTEISKLGGEFVLQLEDCEGCIKDYCIAIKNSEAIATIDNRPKQSSSHGVGLHFRQFETILNKKLSNFRPGKAGACDSAVKSVSRPENCFPGEC